VTLFPSRKIRTLQDVVAWRLCCGCGACAYAMPEGSVHLVNFEDVGIRPCFINNHTPDIENLSYCPGYRIADTNLAPKITRGDHEFGVALEIWEGHASDAEIRYRASSGGILSALALYCLENEGMKLVVHTAMDEKQPWLNRTVISRTRTEILARTGSRYSPSSPCEGLKWIEESDGPCVFIGRPCDVAAVSALRRHRPQLDKKLGLVLTFFCAGTPSTLGTLELLKRLGASIPAVQSIRYRATAGREISMYTSAMHLRINPSLREMLGQLNSVSAPALQTLPGRFGTPGRHILWRCMAKARPQ